MLKVNYIVIYNGKEKVVPPKNSTGIYLAHDQPIAIAVHDIINMYVYVVDVYIAICMVSC